MGRLSAKLEIGTSGSDSKVELSDPGAGDVGVADEHDLDPVAAEDHVEVGEGLAAMRDEVGRAGERAGQHRRGDGGRADAALPRAAAGRRAGFEGRRGAGFAQRGHARRQLLRQRGQHLADVRPGGRAWVTLTSRLAPFDPRGLRAGRGRELGGERELAAFAHLEGARDALFGERARPGDEAAELRFGRERRAVGRVEQEVRAVDRRRSGCAAAAARPARSAAARP